MCPWPMINSSRVQIRSSILKRTSSAMAHSTLWVLKHRHEMINSLNRKIKRAGLSPLCIKCGRIKVDKQSMYLLHVSCTTIGYWVTAQVSMWVHRKPHYTTCQSRLYKELGKIDCSGQRGKRDAKRASLSEGKRRALDWRALRTHSKCSHTVVMGWMTSQCGERCHVIGW